MTSRDFAYWLQGFFEISNPKTLDIEQTEMVKRHLNLVFKHEIDPSMGDEPDVVAFPKTEEEAIAKWGSKPSPEHKFNMHGWYHPDDEGLARC